MDLAFQFLAVHHTSGSGVHQLQSCLCWLQTFLVKHWCAFVSQIPQSVEQLDNLLLIGAALLLTCINYEIASRLVSLPDRDLTLPPTIPANR